MNDIINKASSYYDRTSSTLNFIKADNWKVIRKELARVNIDSMVVEMQIDHDTKLIFPFIIKRNKIDEYTLVESLSNQGLCSSDTVISFNEFRQNYSNEFMILECKPFIEPRSPYFLKIINDYKSIFDPIFLTLSVLLLIIWFTSIANILPILCIGLALLWYYKSFENKINYKSQFCIEKGIFSCKKSNLYSISGFSFSDLGIFYFLGCILALGLGSYTLSYSVIALLAMVFSLFTFYLQIFKERKICLICTSISVIIFVNFIFSFYKYHAPIALSNEIFTVIAYFLVFYFMVRIIRIINVPDISIIRDFNMIMSEWSFVKSVSQNFDVNLKDSEIVIGNSDAEKTLKLVVHLGCKHCPEALREMINLVLLDESYCLHLYIKSNKENKDVMYYNRILAVCKEKKYEEVFRLYIKWKEDKSNGIKASYDSKNLFHHLQIIDDSLVTHFPTIFYDNLQISNFPRFDNIKISIINS